MAEHVAIVGAGISGLAAARRLRRAGIACTVFDKGRGLGGRMATRRAGAFSFDHGCPHFTAERPRFRALVGAWRAAGHAAVWFDGTHVGVPGMSAPARAMLEGAAIVTGCQVTALRRNRAGWTIGTAEGPAEAPGNGEFSAVILALPAPQIAPLAAAAGVDIPALSRVVYAPCWALKLGFAGHSGMAEERLRPDDGPITWIGRDSAKPGRDAGRETVVVHAAAPWSRANLEEHREAVADMLGPTARDLAGIKANPDFVAAHRWRYARVETPAGLPFLWDPTSGIGACGDWCLGPGVEAAFESGEDLAGAVLDSREAHLAG